MKNNLAEAVGNAPSLEVVHRIISACNEAKGKDLSVLNVSKIFDLSDYFVIVSGRSDRQVQGIANRVTESLKEIGLEPIAVEGMDDGHWVLMDFGDIVLHIFYEKTRDYYDIEKLWGRAEKVDLKKKVRSSTLSRAA